MNEILLKGKVVIEFDIKVITGLRIGGAETGLKIGGVDQPFIRTKDEIPYIPGSSLKGKMRSLLEKLHGKDFDEKSGLHLCDEKEREICEICKIFGTLPPENKSSELICTRLYVRDIFLKGDPQDFIEIKTETAINRIDSRATGLRTFDRVCAGAVFSPGEMVFNIFEEEDKKLLQRVFEAMALVEDDYIGSSGSRGYGKIKFENIKITYRKKDNYENGTSPVKIGEYTAIYHVLPEFDNIRKKLN